MIATISLFILIIQSISCTDVCNQEPASGFCKASLVKYYYDQSTGLCTDFVYGGCGGNENRFDTLEECQSRCTKVVKPLCELDSSAGPCRANFLRYYYNKMTKNCELFSYGGCNGNANNFENYHDCMKTCL